jgi:hypothetical protein
MIQALSIIAIFGIIVFLSGVAFGAFVVLIISMRKTTEGPLSEASYGPAGTISRRMLIGGRNRGREINK